MAKFVPLVIALVVLVTALAWPRSELTSKEFLDQIYAASGQVDLTATKGTFDNMEVPIPTAEIADLANAAPPKVLGDSTGEKWIEINLSTQQLIAHQGNEVIFNFPVSTGLPWTPTVTGQFYIWAKVRAQRMTGGNVAAGTFYDLPNVPFVQYFYKGYGIHGAYWHLSFGHPISHGCVNLKIPDAQALYYWTNPPPSSDHYTNTKIQPQESTRVVVYGTTPAA